MKRIPEYATSDWHIGHDKAIDYDDRPFRNVDHMHEVLIKNYNATVPENGICYFLGDIGLTNKQTTREVISKLNGIKVLVLGNHDEGRMSMWNCGFDVVIHNFSTYLHGQLLTASHCPLRGIMREDTSNMGSHMGENWHGERTHHLYSIEDRGQFHIHGHIHSHKNRKISQTFLGRQMDVGCVAHNYRPVSFAQIESWIMKSIQKGL